MVFIFFHRCRILIKPSEKLYLLLHQRKSKTNVYVDVDSFKSEKRKSFIVRVY